MGGMFSASPIILRARTRKSIMVGQSSKSKKIAESFVLSAFLFTFAAGYQVLPGAAVRFNGLPTFENERLARICLNLKCGSFKAVDSMQ